MKKGPPFTRRQVVKGMAASSFFALLGANLSSCSDNDGGDPFNESSYQPLPAEATVSFDHGVASGDPLADRVILWTRATPSQPGRVDLQWELAGDASFNEIVARGATYTDPDVDYTAKVDVGGLRPGTAYFYRFRFRNTNSVVGRTRTLPEGSIAQASFAVFSCSNYPAGFFHAYREAAQRDFDAVLHLGDYIYEYGPGGDAEALGRLPEPPREILSLSDYRTRYAQYRSDADCHAVHAAHPFIAVWDDHEIANDAWREGAENHDPATEGPYAQRRRDAVQAYFEWMPIRPPSTPQEIYRDFRFGDLVDLFMLDTRHIGRDLQLDFADFTTGEIVDAEAVRAAAADPARTLLGEEQKDWLIDRLINAQSTWQVLGQQVIMGRAEAPAPIVRAIRAGDTTNGIQVLLAAVAAKQKDPADRTPEEEALLAQAVPYNLDAWDGYAAEREEIFEQARQLQRRLVVLSGDTHNSWANQLRNASGDVVGVEYAGTSVTSPGFEQYVGLVNDGAAAFFENALYVLIDDLRYLNARSRGYMAVTFTPTAANAEWIHLDTVKTPEYRIVAERSKRLTASADTLLIQDVT
jgi:alkaline phosphatase D